MRSNKSIRCCRTWAKSAAVQIKQDAALKGLAQFIPLKDPAALERWRVHAPFYKDVHSPAVEGVRAVKDFVDKSDPQRSQADDRKSDDAQYGSQLEKEVI
jgi:hypothetical protein